ncbi:MAG: hypothetical protein ACTSRK_12145 [Promethearchaeota archaeon]
MFGINHFSSAFGFSELALIDSDFDGIIDQDETLIYNTNPYSNDTDIDGYNDFYEISEGFDPLDWNDPEPIDIDNDGQLIRQIKKHHSALLDRM